MGKKFHGLKMHRVKKGKYRTIRKFDRWQHEEFILIDRETYKWPNRFRYKTFWKSLRKIGEKVDEE